MMRFITDLSKGILGKPDPVEMWEQIIAHIPDSVLLKKDLKILFPACGHGTEADLIAKRMLKLGRTADDVKNSFYLLDKFKVFTNEVMRKGYTNVITADFLEWNTDIKFDYVIMSPPYTKGRVMLYVYFFKKALELSKDKVITVLPINFASKHDKLKFHHQRLKTHLVFQSENISHYFKTGYDNIFYVIADINVKNEVVEEVDPISNLEILYPKRERLKPIKGDTDIARGEDVKEGIKTIWKVHSGDKVLYKHVEPEKVAKSNKSSNANYLVIVNHTPSKGKFNCVVLPNTGMHWSMWTFAFECDTEQEANSLKSWLQSDEIVSYINEMLTLRNKQFTISKAMIETLPNYK